MKAKLPLGRLLIMVAAVLFSGATLATLVAPIASAQSDSCPDIQVVFARGTGEPAGVGRVGDAFVDACARWSAASPSRYTP